MELHRLSLSLLGQQQSFYIKCPLNPLSSLSRSWTRSKVSSLGDSPSPRFIDESNGKFRWRARCLVVVTDVIHWTLLGTISLCI